MHHALNDLGQQLLDAARIAGADMADAIVVDGLTHSIDVHAGKLEHAERAEGIDLGLRVMIGQQQACVSASDTSKDTITTMAERAVAMARHAPTDPHMRQAHADELAKTWDLDALELADPSDEPEAQVLMAAALEAEENALAVKGVSQCQAASSAYGTQRIQLCLSNGFAGGYARSSNSLSCVAIAGTGTGMERDYDGDFRIFRDDLRSAADIGASAGTRAISQLGARKPPTGTYPVLFDERISSSLMGHLLGAVNGSSVARGASWLRDCLGQQILPANLSLHEDPTRPRVAGSHPFDAEGLAAAPRYIVENGVLQDWTMDLATAAKLGRVSTASARRGTSSPPSPGTGNVTLTQGEDSQADLLKSMGTGLLLTSLIGSSVNDTTGDYSRGASGFWVENGEITYPVNECTIAGNLKDMLREIVPADDAKPYLSTVVPSLLVPRMILAGG